MYKIDKVVFKHKRLQPIQNIPYCPDCDVALQGSRTGINNSLGSFSQHTCPLCKKEYTLDGFYPKITYEDLGFIIDQHHNTCESCNSFGTMEATKLTDADSAAYYPRATVKCKKCGQYYWNDGEACK